MTPERWQQIDELLNQVREQPTAERPVFLDAACGEDLDLREEVETLLEFDEQAAFLDGSVFSVHDEDQDVGQYVGHYELVRLLGRGGMGAVYLAARRDDYTQQVALKLIKRGMDTDEIVRRFRNERQILADLDHPNIARLLDGGTTDDGRPYFVMEYIEGEPIDRYCDQHRLSTKERLKLFLQVCSAVQVSHQNLVVHRDLKPSNILVTEQGGVPKLLDFGIAKMVAPEPIAQSLATLPGRGPMTLKYASPEQARGELVTTASDTYSLGVLLYRMLTGHHPNELEELETPSDEEISRRIREHEPPKPSTAIRRQLDVHRTDGTTLELSPESVSSTRDGDPRKLRRCLSGDLDAIVMKALRKEPTRRYGSVEQFAEDIRRHLGGLPVTARRGTFIYRTGKYVRRNRWALVVMLITFIFTATTTVLWLESDAERRRGDKIAKLLKEFLKSFDPNRSELSASRAILESGKQLIGDAWEKDPKDWVDVAGVLGEIYRSAGDYEEARDLLEKSISVLREEYPEGHSLLAERYSNLAVVCSDMGDTEEAENYSRKALSMRVNLGQGNMVKSVKTLNNLASILVRRGEYAEAEQLYREGLKIRRREYGDRLHPHMATSLRNLGNVLFLQGDAEQAEPLLRRALEIRHENYGRRHLKVASVLDKLGSVRQALGHFEEAQALYTEALETRRKLLDEKDHADIARTQTNLASLLLVREPATPENLSTAYDLLQHALETLQGKKKVDDWEVARVESLIGDYLTHRGRYPEAESYLTKALQNLEEGLSSDGVYSQAARERLQRLDEVRDPEEERASEEPHR